MQLDKDLSARQEARDLARQAAAAQTVLRTMDQSRLDAITRAISEAFACHAEALAQEAVTETGFGNVRDKTTKNRFAAHQVYEAIRDMKTVGILRKDPQRKVWEVGIPVGPICAIVPSTNPTSTVCYKALIALKSGNALVFSPHPKAVGCTLHACQIVEEAARKAGAPAGSIGCLTKASMAGCQELMASEHIQLILATGGPGMVKAAYSSGKPAIGVGAGNGPCYIHRTADVGKALDCILRSKTFDNGTVCASEQSIVVEQALEQTVRQEAQRRGFYFMDTDEAHKLSKLLFRPNGTLDPRIVGRDALTLAQMAGICVPPTTRILVAREQEAGPTRPYSMEKLCPVLAFFVMDSEEAVLQKAIEVLSHEGRGHTFSMHCEDPEIVARFALQIPVSRFLVDTPAVLGGIGASTGLFPALTLGCGAIGGSSSSNNISPMDLIDLRRIAWHLPDRAPTATPLADRETAPTAGSHLTDAPPQDLIDLLTQKILQRLD